MDLGVGCAMGAVNRQHDEKAVVLIPERTVRVASSGANSTLVVAP